MGIEAIVKKYGTISSRYRHINADQNIRAALTELAAGYEKRIDALMASHTEQMQELQRDKEYCCCGECTTLTPSTVGEREALQERIHQLSETHAIELRAYEATVANMAERIRQLEAERASPELLAFLRGAAPLEGVWFGHKHPTKHAPYWWRSYLGAHVLPSAPEKEDSHND